MTEDDRIETELAAFRQGFEALRAEIAKVIVGQEEIVEDTLNALVVGGHVLLEGVPGLGKTLLVRTLSQALDLEFKRIQFTPDLMPADLSGTNVVVEGTDGMRRFEFQRGPLFANVVLADEINRATPKTQSALLEAMAEGSVSVGGTTHAVPQPFFVLATQNPLEMEGTYPLPEAQLDRFLFKLVVPFPTADQMESIVERTTVVDVPHAERIYPRERVLAMQRLARQVPLAAEVRRFAVEIVEGTHPGSPLAPSQVKRFVRYGASPRGAQAIVLAAKVRAILNGRYNVAREDVLALAKPALRHRVLLNFEGQAEGIAVDAVLDQVLESRSAAHAARS